MRSKQPQPAGNEFDIIRKYFDRAHNAQQSSAVAVGIGDDAAILNELQPGRSLVTCIDTLVSGRHFPVDAPAADIGWKALAVNLSDLAAMGAAVEWFQLALTLPAADAPWLAAFSCGLFEAAGEYGVQLVGGDTTRGPLAITIQAAGNIATGAALTRNGAQPGDQLWLSGPVGGGALGLQQWNAGQRSGAAINQLNRPQPQLLLGQKLIGIATSAIDISDGLLQDLNHILSASGVGATVAIDQLPLFNDGDQSASIEMALAGGDDYQLLFTAPANAAEEIERLCSASAVDETVDKISPITHHLKPSCIGLIEKKTGLRCIDAAGAPYTSLGQGWQHF